MAFLALGAPSGLQAQDLLQDTTNANNSFLGDTIGQSFVAPAARLGSIGFYYADANPQLAGASIQMTLYEGAGTGGAVLASDAQDLEGYNGWADFDFSAVTLVAGATYTFTVANTVSGRGSYDWQQADVYADGTRYVNGGAAFGDLRFRVTSGLVVPCNLVDNGDGTVTVECDDGTSFTISNEPGADGANGADGTSCTVTDNGDGTATIDCTDGSSATISNGANGADGTSCTVTDNGDGTATIACTDGSSAIIANGADGADGTSCDVVDNGDGTSTVTCGAASVVIENGQDGQDGDSCSVVDNLDGTATITCSDGTTADIGSAAGGGGCSVSPSATGPATSLGWLALAAGLLVLRRRRVA